MHFGVDLGGDPTTAAREARLLEQRGFSAVWFPEVPLIGYGDPYVCMSQAASATERVTLGTFIAPAGMRATPTLVTQFATVNRLAPGRVVMGYASGSFSRKLVGMPTLRVRDLRDELTVIRSLLDNGKADYDGTEIRFHHWPRPCMNITDPINVQVAASGPRTAGLAGELGDGLITTGEHRPERLRALLESAHAGAVAAGRDVENFQFVVDVGPLCVVRPGEAIDSQRVLEIVQPIISTYFAYFLMSELPPEAVEPPARDAYARFLAWASERFGPVLEDQFRGLCDDYVARNPEHDQFVTPDVIRVVTITGPLEEIAERLEEFERIGVTQATVLRAFDRPYRDDDELRDLVEVMERVG